MDATINTYLICASYNNFKKGSHIIKQFVNSDNSTRSQLLFVENGCEDNFKRYKEDFGSFEKISLVYSESPNKSKCINTLIANYVSKEEALIICVDDDIDFPETFVKRYQEVAFEKGNKYFFGGGYRVPNELMSLADKGHKKMYQPSQFSKTDAAFLNAKRLIFFGCNFCFYKSQWVEVRGYDVRFGPGTKHNLGADESVFQKKMMYVGFKPFFVTNNQVTHYPDAKSYQLESVQKRNIHNGYTHGFSFLIESKQFFKIDFFHRLSGMVKSLIEYKLKKQKQKYVQKKYYTIGHFKALVTFLRIDNRKSIYHNLERIE
ncbi:MAG: hypothetical protein ACQESK_05385 [Bacteroidota bacterium]